MNTHTAPGRITPQVSDLPIARIDSQDISLSLALREYLEQNGCAVVVNRKPAIAPAYHLVIGDPEYVKHTVAQIQQTQIEIYAVILLADGAVAAGDLSHIRAKIAVISKSSLDTRDVVGLFAFFITGKETIHYVQTKGNDQNASATEKPPHEQQGIRSTKYPSVHEVRSPELPAQMKWAIPDEPRHRPGAIENSVPVRMDPPPAVKTKFARYVCIVLLALLFFPVLWYGIAFAAVGVSQYRVLQGLKKGEAQLAESAALQSRYWVGQGEKTLGFMRVALGSVGLSSALRNQERLVSLARELTEAEIQSVRLLKESATVMTALIPSGGDPADWPTLPAVERMRASLSDVSASLGLINAQLDRMMDAGMAFPAFFIKKYDIRVSKAVREMRKQISVMQNALALYRSAGGFDGKKTYLIVFQNSMELRPTGGFIGSIATIGVENGRMESPNIQDVYAVDGQLKGHVDPPRPVKELLNQEHWYLRDSNWDPDFAKSGEKIAWFYEKETGQTVDGVIAVSTPALLTLLDAVGPVTLPDYGDRISKDNFFGKSLFYTQADFFPGSTQKKDFLGSLTGALLARLASIQPDEGKRVFFGLGSSFAGGDVQFWFSDPQTKALSQQAGWAGLLEIQSPCRYADLPCAAVPIALVDANMGVNKVNAYMTRDIKSRVDIDASGVIDGTVRVAYHNASTDDAAVSGGGVYLSYLRTYLPADAVVVSVTLDGQEIPMRNPAGAPPKLPYRDPDDASHGRTVVAMAFAVP